MTPLVTVIMSVHKEPILAVQTAVESILSQTYINWELRIVLDWPDNLVVEEYLVLLSERHPNIHVIKNDTNLGLGASLNKAVACAEGEFCARMDVEDSSFPNRLQKQIEYMQDFRNTDLLFTQWEEVRSDGSVRERRPIADDVRNIQRNFFIKSILLHPTLLVRTEILKKHHYPEMDRPEDWVLFLDLIRLNYKFDLVGEVLYRYHVDEALRFQKVRNYSGNLLPHLYKNVPHYRKNIYFWIYLSRVSCEFLISRNKFIYDALSRAAASIFKYLFKSV